MDLFIKGMLFVCDGKEFFYDFQVIGFEVDKFFCLK